MVPRKYWIQLRRLLMQIISNNKAVVVRVVVSLLLLKLLMVLLMVMFQIMPTSFLQAITCMLLNMGMRISQWTTSSAKVKIMQIATTTVTAVAVAADGLAKFLVGIINSANNNNAKTPPSMAQGASIGAVGGNTNALCLPPPPLRVGCRRCKGGRTSWHAPHSCTPCRQNDRTWRSSIPAS